MKKQLLYKISLYCGLVPLIGGLFIFCTWWIAKAFYAIDLNSFERFGLLWIFISIPIAISGIILLVIYFIKNYPQDFKRPILGAILILINIPVVNLVVDKQSKLDQRAYVKIYNRGIQSLNDLKIKGFYYEKEIGTLDRQTSTVIYFYPPNYDPSDGFPPVDTIRILGHVKSEKINIVIPIIERGECKRFYIDKDYKLHE